WGAPYTNPSAALGTPDLTQNVPDLFSGGTQIAFADNSAITPFNASYNPTNVVAIQGAGGTITLQLSSPVIIGSGAQLGFHAAVGLQDALFPNGQNLNPAATYTDPRQADLQVSADGVKWVDLGEQAFSSPTNIFSDETDPTGATPGKVQANFFQPFSGSLASFNGADFSQTLGILNGSAGGSWFDVSGVALSDIDFVRLSTADGEKMFLDSVLALSGTTGTVPPPPVTPPPTPTPPPPVSSVPLPGALAMAATLAPLATLALRRRRLY
ncbi:MAG TPA: hypothetical protein VLJ39_21135, partial [Tepidisphaeraceae bacterium]|nr:hypothetical protein [Tepidisphaeraceae bacterium]